MPIPATTAAVDRRRAVPPRWSHVDDHFIDGTYRRSTGDERIEVVDPTTEQTWGSVPQATAADVDAALTAADRALRCGVWSGLAPRARAEHLRRAADALVRHAEELAWTNTRENGTPLAETLGAAD